MQKPERAGEDKLRSKSDIAKREEEILAFWSERGIFEKSLAKPSPKGEYIFYDGPPFATGLPHFGHMLPSTIKDAIPRYKTMRGYHVARRWGWDCHGLPLENQIEEELHIKDKREIEKIGVAKFNEAARNAVLRYRDDWKRIIPRLGRFVDMEHDYKTMDTSYTESVWWAFKTLHKKDLIYEGFKAMHLCPRCGTTLANFEVAQGYKDIEDYAIVIKLPLINEPQTSLLIWTTTPWTLPGNAAAAVKADAQYVKAKVGNEFIIVAKERLQSIAPGAEVEAFMTGKELVGKAYLPPFDYFVTELHKHKTHAWKVYAADFVNMEEGTGVVHIAPAFGEDDLKLSQVEKIPLIRHVSEGGTFTAVVRDFAHLPVKPKGRHQETDAKIVANLKERHLLFGEETITHSYPHCWRCDTPLLNWVANSWFVNVGTIKKKLLSENKKINWVPEHVGKGRFGNNLASAPDWAISRSRFWGAPLPVWRNQKSKKIKIVGSVAELLSLVRGSGNRYFVMRHGEARSNVAQVLESTGDPENHLTERGKDMVKISAEGLKREKIDLIVTSPFVRTRETAAIVQKELGLSNSAVMVDERLCEVGTGIFSGKSVKEWYEFYGSLADRFAKPPQGGETFTAVRQRVGEFLFEIESRYTNKNVLIVSHGNPVWLMSKIAERIASASLEKEILPKQAEVKELLFTPFPHNENYELDLHRPYVDDITLGDPLQGYWKRVPDVFDCWFESGSMPFASNHYPTTTSRFNPKRFFGFFPKGYPADFISESIDQTRGWFYSLIVLGVALFGRSPYKTVITNGTILAQDGRKMSKRLKNFPDLLETVDRYGADALRYFLLSSPLIRGEDSNFSVRGVEEVMKKLLMRLENVRAFYALYADGTKRSSTSSHVLDRWILSRLSQLIQQTTKGFESYELDVATRPLADFIDDLSVWYVRRSRERFKEEGSGKQEALGTLRFILYTLAHAMAPVLPFFAEHLFLAVKEPKEPGDPESVHLCSWPQAGAVDEGLLKEMQTARTIASKALELRERAGIKIRQPLATLKTKIILSPEMQKILMQELNVKEVVHDAALQEDVWLDITLTPELQEEGVVRNLMRRVQEWRKEQKLNIADRPAFVLKVSKEDAIVAQKYRDKIAKETGLNELAIEVE